MKKLPWTSLALLLVTYFTFGWQLYTWESRYIWLMGVAFALLIAWVLTSPGRIMRICFGGVLTSDTQAFISIIVGTCVGVMLLRWFAAFAHFLLLLAATMLARLDLQIRRFSQRRAFLILAFVSLAGFGIGLAMHHLLAVYQVF